MTLDTVAAEIPDTVDAAILMVVAAASRMVVAEADGDRAFDTGLRCRRVSFYLCSPMFTMR